MQSMMDLFDLPATTSLDFLRDIASQLNVVKLDPQQQAKLKGKQIGDALVTLRKQHIDQAMNN